MSDLVEDKDANIKGHRPYDRSIRLTWKNKDIKLKEFGNQKKRKGSVQRVARGRICETTSHFAALEYVQTITLKMTSTP